MKTGKTLTELAQELDRQRNEMKDFIAPLSQTTLEVDEENKYSLKLGDSGKFGITELAHEQIATFTDIPKKYYDKMLNEANLDSSLLTRNVNHWFDKSKDSQRMVRTLDGDVRAFLSNRYRPLDNYDLAQVALPALMEAGCQIESCEITDTRMYLKAVTPKLNFEVKKGDVIQAGILIQNSEVGKGALSIEPLLFRLVCENGLIINDAKIRKAHLGRGNEEFGNIAEFFRDSTKEADDKAFWMKVRDLITASFTNLQFETFVNKFAATAQEPIVGDPLKVVQVAQKHFGLFENERNDVLKHLLSGGDLTKFGFINAVTRAAQDVTSYDRSTELEKIGGAIIELPKKDWSMIAEAA